MAFEDIQFPVYRKYKNNNTFFKITSRNRFEEIQIIGARVKLNVITTNQFPEMNHIYDLVYNHEGLGSEITENEWLEQLKKVQKWIDFLLCNFLKFSKFRIFAALLKIKGK